MPPTPTHFRPQRILVGTDFSEWSSAALRLAEQIADRFSATLVILHAIPPPRSVSPISRAVVLPERNEGLATIENEMVMSIRKVIGRRPMPDYRILVGHTAEAILFAAGYDKADLVILGTRGKGGQSRLTLGSVAERVLRLARVPVLTIGPRSAAKSRRATFRRILCPVNYSAAARRALEVSVSLGAAFDADVIALRVMEETTPDGDLDAEAQRLRLWLRDLIPKPSRPTPLVLAGDAATGVLSHAEENEIDLIVVGAAREPFSDVTVLGATTERVTRSATCAVLTVILLTERAADPPAIKSGLVADDASYPHRTRAERPKKKKP
jgi:nucleotide-binding universal stress UspA family protein